MLFSSLNHDPQALNLTVELFYLRTCAEHVNTILSRVSISPRIVSASAQRLQLVSFGLLSITNELLISRAFDRHFIASIIAFFVITILGVAAVLKVC